jgi:isoamylase
MTAVLPAERSTAVRIWPGEPYPLGATFDGAGTNFSVYSEDAERVELCLFGEDGTETRIDLPEVTAYCWHGYVPGLHPGRRYGFRAHGPWTPQRGLRFNPAKLLLDPYAKAIEGEVTWTEAVFSHLWKSPDARNDADSAPFVPRSVVSNPYFDWRDDQGPRTPFHDSVFYEMHVKGFTMRHPDIEPEVRGTYAGIAHPAAIDHLKKLGVTAVELLPVHQFVSEQHLVDQGLRNYWGYNSIGFFAPHNAYSAAGHAGEQVAEFKQMVRALHQAGIEVILDVVYNHTAEGNHLGPTLSFRGIDNGAYYRLVDNDRRYYMDYTGTGNSLNMRHPQTLQLVMDSLRYWILEMHVDGFRFDLAAALARGLHEVDRLSAFFDLVHQDPVVSRVKLIAEPWDVGDGGYQVGNFPPLWSEWNGRYRDCVRDLWKGADTGLAEFGYRITGSSDLYENTGRRPYASVNFITAHDGFTLADLVSYNDKHNDANGEGNRDGTNDNRSWNCGAEGPTEDPGIVALRQRQQRNLLTTLLLSQGVPMLLSGDEIGRTQHGNNNAYCQDNELSWLDWEHADSELLEFAQKLIAFRRDHSVFHQRGWFLGRAIHNVQLRDIGWFTPGGVEMTDHDWDQGWAKAIGLFLNGEAGRSVDERGNPELDDSFFIMLNAHHEPIDFTFPAEDWGPGWECEVDTTSPAMPPEEHARQQASATVRVEARSLQVFRRAR